MPRGLFIAGWVLVLLAAVMSLAAGFGFVRERNFLTVAARTQATVVEMVEQKGNKGTTYAPACIFADASGNEHKLHSSWGSYPPAYDVGDRVTVLYDPQSPRRAQIEDYWDMWGWMTIVCGFAVVEAVIGSALLFVSKTQRNKAANQG